MRKLVHELKEERDRDPDAFGLIVGAVSMIFPFLGIGLGAITGYDAPFTVGGIILMVLIWVFVAYG